MIHKKTLHARTKKNWATILTNPQILYWHPTDDPSIEWVLNLWAAMHRMEVQAPCILLPLLQLVKSVAEHFDFSSLLMSSSFVCFFFYFHFQSRLSKLTCFYCHLHFSAQQVLEVQILWSPSAFPTLLFSHSRHHCGWCWGPAQWPSPQFAGFDIEEPCYRPTSS